MRSPILKAAVEAARVEKMIRGGSQDKAKTYRRLGAEMDRQGHGGSKIGRRIARAAAFLTDRANHSRDDDGPGSAHAVPKGKGYTPRKRTMWAYK